MNGDRNMVRDIEYRLVPDHGEWAFCLIKSLELHETSLRDQMSAIEVRHEDTSAFQDWNIPFIVNNLTVKVYLMSCFQGGTNAVH